MSSSDSADADSWNQVAKKADSVTKSTRPIIETPQSISVITQAQMASQAALNVSKHCVTTQELVPKAAVQIIGLTTSISVVLPPMNTWMAYACQR
ncbi:hypothetical protein LZ023_35865 (plasmid) [Pseudomonas silvicola]|nr:hypothetical protein LZ023_35865 [Pseudomonas silvicola]